MLTSAAPGAAADWLEAAARAEAGGDLEQALRLWAACRQVRPAAIDGYLPACAALRKAGRLDEAAMLAAAAAAQPFGRQFRMLAEAARIAEGREDFAAALRIWQDLQAQAPARELGYEGTLRMLLKLGRTGEAHAYADPVISRFPQAVTLLRLAARASAAEQAWPEALRRWDLVLAVRPGDQSAMRGRGAAIWQMRNLSSESALDEETEPEHRPDLVAVERVDDPVAHALVLAFESLGQNCEFGLVQRRFQAEPLGLLRWSSVKPRTLAALLETQFSGLGEAPNAHVIRTSWGEYCVQDTRFDLTFHTFNTSAIEDTDKFLAKQCARLRWLRDKLLADLEEGAKIFVYKGSRPMADADIERIVRALRRYGRARLLCVEAGGEGSVPGSVQDCGGGLMRGTLSVVNPHLGRWNIPYDEWLSICHRAMDLQQGLLF